MDPIDFPKDSEVVRLQIVTPIFTENLEWLMGYLHAGWITKK